MSEAKAAAAVVFSELRSASVFTSYSATEVLGVPRLSTITFTGRVTSEESCTLSLPPEGLLPTQRTSVLVRVKLASAPFPEEVASTVANFSKPQTLFWY